MNGWIKLHRQIQDNTLWLSDEPFDCRSAWIDLIMMANHESREIFMNNNFITIERGQLHRSQLKLAERWHWSRERVNNYLKNLKKAGMIDFTASTNGTTRGTTITIVNYDKYQVDHSADLTTNPTTDRQQTIQQADNKPDINKNIKNVKEGKEGKKDIYSSSISQIFDYLNQQTGKKYTGRSDAQRKQIIARLKEGYTVEEFKQVIDNKCREWKHDEKMQMYLRPETLFSTKFETYLNDTETERQRARREEAEIHERQQKDLEETISYCDIETLFG